MMIKEQPAYSEERAKALGIVLERLVRLLYPQRAPGSLQPLQWSILRFFTTADEQTATVSDAARYLGLSHAPVSRAVQTLLTKRMLEKVENPEDRRGSIYHLSENGRETIKSDPFFVLVEAMDTIEMDRANTFEQTMLQVVLHIALKKDKS